LGEVRGWYLYFVDFVKVCPRFIEQIVLGRPSDIAVWLVGPMTIRVTRVFPIGRHFC